MSTPSTAIAPEMINEFKEMVRQEWTDPATVAAWGKWRVPMSVQTAETTTAIVQAAQIAPGMQVLDIASGTGEPLRAVARLVGPAGHVTAADLGAGMLSVAEESAREAGLHNITFRQADAHALPFAGNSFDRVTCRFGVMYFADAPHAFSEIYRVLKPGGRVAFIAWGQLQDNPFMLCSLGPLFKRVQVPPPPPGAPTPFKYGAPGSLSSDLEGAGFKRVEEETRQMAFPWPGTPDNLWEHFQDVAAPFRPIIESLPPNEKAAAISEILDGYRQFYDGHQINMPASIVVASAVK
jgi:SAM-dependent methyltransferase